MFRHQNEILPGRRGAKRVLTLHFIWRCKQVELTACPHLTSVTQDSSERPFFFFFLAFSGFFFYVPQHGLPCVTLAAVDGAFPRQTIGPDKQCRSNLTSKDRVTDSKRLRSVSRRWCEKRRGTTKGPNRSRHMASVSSRMQVV